MGIIDLNAIRQAAATLQEYKQGKANLENRIVENEQWYKMRHWKEFRRDDGGKLPSSGYLFNSILNKHADAMDNYPKPTILPREQSDEETAHKLSEVVPAVLERNDFEQAYSDAWWYKLKQGTGVYGVFWSPSVDDIIIRKVDLLNLFWQPGITDLQESENLFYVSLIDMDILKEEYPKIDFGVKSAPSIDVSQYIFDDAISTNGKVAVVDWYYKKPGADGNPVLHYCKFVGEHLLFASENDPVYADEGFYRHGLYPFVPDILYREEGMPVGFGLIDAMKDAQESIDEMDSNIQWNLRCVAKQRYAIKAGAGVNKKQFTDLNEELVEVQSSDIASAIMPLKTQPLDAAIVQYRDRKIDELKETSGNREFNQGATAGGVTAASAIAQLQEAGNKLSRDAITSSYRAFTKVCILVIELIRQFYTEKRVFRITEPNGSNRFVSFSNESMQERPLGQVQGVDLGSAEPVYDVKVDAQKKAPFSQIAHNQFIMELYARGFFAPEAVEMSIAATNLMEFDGKDQLLKILGNNRQIFAQMQQQQAQINQMAGMLNQVTGAALDPTMQEADIDDNNQV